MGIGFSCFKAADRSTDHRDSTAPDHAFAASDQLDETLGHSFCYVRSSARFLSPTESDRFVSPTHSLRFEDPVSRTRPVSETGFKAISGASVSANTATPRTVLPLDTIVDYASDSCIGGGTGGVATLNGFESTSLFSALPLQPAPRGGGAAGDSGSGFFLSGPIERRFLSGPLDPNSGPDAAGRVPFSAPLGGPYAKKRRKKSMSGIRNAIYKNFSEKKRQWVVPVLNFKKEAVTEDDEPTETAVACDGDDLQWALGKAGEDRVQVVVSEEQGWLFVGIYDGFNGPDAPEFLMDHLYRAVHNELRGLFWEGEEEEGSNITPNETNLAETKVAVPTEENPDQAKRAVTFQSEEMEIQPHRRRLWEFLADPEDGLLDLSGPQRFTFSVDEAIAAGSSESKRWLLLSKLKQGLSGQPRKLFPWRFGLKEKESAKEVDTAPLEEERSTKTGMKRKEGPADHQLVLVAMSKALESVENAYLDITDKVLDMNPELALMGSCLLVVLMRDEDVYVMNLGDSRAIVAQFDGEDIVVGESSSNNKVPTPPPMRLSSLQLSTDHSTSIEEEVIRIKNEHPDDNQCIVNDRVKGRLKVTRAFGAGFLKQPKLNDAVLEMFRNDYIGNAPYISSCPSLCHHELCPRDQFLVLSSDGLYQYFSNEEVVAHIESFMEKFPDGDPAQHLIEELLSRAAKKAGMDLNELLDIPQGDRRKYHDDVTVMVISLEGRIWKSSGKYF